MDIEAEASSWSHAREVTALTLTWYRSADTAAAAQLSLSLSRLSPALTPQRAVASAPSNGRLACFFFFPWLLLRLCRGAVCSLRRSMDIGLIEPKIVNRVATRRRRARGGLN